MNIEECIAYQQLLKSVMKLRNEMFVNTKSRFYDHRDDFKPALKHPSDIDMLSRYRDFLVHVFRDADNCDNIIHKNAQNYQ